MDALDETCCGTFILCQIIVKSIEQYMLLAVRVHHRMSVRLIFKRPLEGFDYSRRYVSKCCNLMHNGRISQEQHALLPCDRVAVLDFSSVSDPDLFLPFLSNCPFNRLSLMYSSRLLIRLRFFLLTLDVIPFLLMQLVTRLMPALKYSLFPGKLRGHSQIAQSTLVFLLQIHNSEEV